MTDKPESEAVRLDGHWHVRINRTCPSCYAPNYFVASNLSETHATVLAWTLDQLLRGRTITALISPQEAANTLRYAGYYCEDYKGPRDVG